MATKQEEQKEQSFCDEASPINSSNNSEINEIEVNQQDSDAELNLENQLQIALQKAQSAHENQLRILAESENMRKRMEKEKSDFLKFGMEKFFHSLLPVLDSFDKALGEVSEDKEEFKGFLLIQKQLLEILERNGLQTIESENKPFDPLLHQAISKIEQNDHEKETVGKEFAKGYLLHGRLIRPAMVCVYSPKES